MEIEDIFNTKFIDEHYNELFEYLGWFGKYSIRIFTLILILIAVGAMHIVAPVYIAAVPHFTCNTTTTTTTVNRAFLQNITQMCEIDESSEEWINFKQLHTSPQCQYPTFLNETSPCSYLHRQQLGSTPCDEWVYNTSLFASTVVTEFNLVCGDDEWSNRTALIMMVGIMCGATLMGVLSDKYGRLISFKVAILVLIVSSIVCTFSPNVLVFAITRFFVGFGAIGSCVAGYVYTLEMIDKKYRVVVAQVVQCTYSVGFMIFALIGYLDREWRSLNLILCALLIPPFIIYLRMGGESPRWLLSQNRGKELKKLIYQMASANNKDLKQFNGVHLEIKANPIVTTTVTTTKEESRAVQQSSDSSEPLQLSSSDTLGGDTQLPQYTSLHLLRNPILRNMMLVLFFNWFTTTCIYYGLTFSVTSQNGDPFINLFLSGLVEIPANLGAIWAVMKFGRRSVISSANFLCGVSLLTMVFIAQDSMLRTALYHISKFASSAIFSCIYLYTSEMFPTPLRGNALGMCSASSRLGGIASQLILMKAVKGDEFPNYTFGSMAIASGCLLLLLPETRGTSLPDTIDDSEEIYKRNRLLSIPTCSKKEGLL